MMGFALGCTPTGTVVTPAGATPGIDLPVARHAQALVPGPIPRVTATPRDVLIDGQIVGDARAIAAVGRPHRVDGLFAALTSTREKWKSSHSGAPFPGVVLLSFDPGDSTALVKSVFQTAAFAGYPNAELAVRTASGDVAALPVSAEVPGPPGTSVAPDHRDGLVVLVGRSLIVSWEKAGAVVSTTDLGALADLPTRAQKEWNEHGEHRGAREPARDRAVVYFDNGAPYAELANVLDALVGVARSTNTGGDPLPAFDVTLSIAEQPPPVAPLAAGTKGAAGGGGGKGRLAPEVIQRTVRSHFGEYRACYETGLRRHPNLGGKVSIRFVIDPRGGVSEADDAGSTLPDPQTVACILDAFRQLSFPAPEGGIVTVVYPINFNAGD
jgi:hypothetical protein